LNYQRRQLNYSIFLIVIIFILILIFSYYLFYLFVNMYCFSKSEFSKLLKLVNDNDYYLKGWLHLSLCHNYFYRSISITNGRISYVLWSSLFVNRRDSGFARDPAHWNTAGSSTAYFSGLHEITVSAATR